MGKDAWGLTQQRNKRFQKQVTGKVKKVHPSPLQEGYFSPLATGYIYSPATAVVTCGFVIYSDI